MPGERIKANEAAASVSLYIVRSVHSISLWLTVYIRILATY